MVMFSNNVEPANGFLLRYLHRKAVEAYQDQDQDLARHQELLQVLDWIPQLWYHLHAFLEKHSTSDFLIGEILADRVSKVRLGYLGESCYDKELLTKNPASSRSLLFPVMPSVSGGVQAVVH